MGASVIDSTSTPSWTSRFATSPEGAGRPSMPSAGTRSIRSVAATRVGGVVNLFGFAAGTRAGLESGRHHSPRRDAARDVGREHEELRGARSCDRLWGPDSPRHRPDRAVRRGARCLHAPRRRKALRQGRRSDGGAMSGIRRATPLHSPFAAGAARAPHRDVCTRRPPRAGVIAVL